MTIFKCSHLLTNTGWGKNTFVKVSDQGLLEDLSQDPIPGQTVALDGYVIPGFQNGHSHAFQYAMAGIAEHMPANAAQDDFWSWREAMYNLASSITHDQLQAVATMLYAEMLRNGTTHVVEFHYLHNHPEGKRYRNEDELAARMIAAAEATGIELTIVPVFYRWGGFGKPATEKQRRFLSHSVDEYLSLIDKVRFRCKNTDTVCGTGIHSLRAATGPEMKEILNAQTTGPIHIHIAEQQKEIDDCLEHYGKRPVQWMLDEFAIDRKFCFTHATHMDDNETKTLAASGATVVICPSTEGNLGDGFFNLVDYRKHGGYYTIGSDSHIGLSPLEDLRWLDYVQRLRHEKRNIICQEALEDSATTLIRDSWIGGRRARGEYTDEYFAKGSSFDCVVLDPEHPSLIGKPESNMMGAAIYAGDVTAIKSVVRRGKIVVQNGRHHKFDEFKTAYRKALRDIYPRTP